MLGRVLYEGLGRMTGSPVVRLSRAIARDADRRALSLTDNPAERALLLERIAQ